LARKTPKTADWTYDLCFSVVLKEFQAEVCTIPIRVPPRRGNIAMKQRTEMGWDVHKFPDIILFLILDRLDPASVLSVIPLVCKRFNSICLEFDSPVVTSLARPSFIPGQKAKDGPKTKNGPPRMDGPKVKDQPVRSTYLRVHRDVRRFVDGTAVPDQISIDLFILNLLPQPPIDQVYAIGVRPRQSTKRDPSKKVEIGKRGKMLNHSKPSPDSSEPEMDHNDVFDLIPEAVVDFIESLPSLEIFLNVKALMLRKITIDPRLVNNIGCVKLDLVYLNRCKEYDPQIYGGVSTQSSSFHLVETKQVYITLDRKLRSSIVLSKRTEEFVLSLSNDIDIKSSYIVVNATSCERLGRV
jgi:hypothetical protein